MDFVQAVITEAGIYPPSAENRQGERTRHVARRLELPAIVACVCKKNINFEEESMKKISEQLGLRPLFNLLHFV